MDDLVDNLDVDVPLDSVENDREIICRKDDSQDVPIHISSQVSRNFGNSQMSNAGEHDRQEVEVEGSPQGETILRQDDCNTAAGTCAIDNQTAHLTFESSALQKENTTQVDKADKVRDAMEIADEL